jgi:hypothetical protein
MLHCELERAAFVSVLTEASNYKEITIFCMLVLYFVYKSGVKGKVLELKSLFGKTTVNVNDYLSDCLTENCLVGKVVGLCADNTNSNFGSAERKRQNSVLPNCRKTLGMV